MEKPDVDHIRGPVARPSRSSSARPRTTRARPSRTIDRDLRLPPRALRAHRRAALPPVRPADQPRSRSTRSSPACSSGSPGSGSGPRADGARGARGSTGRTSSCCAAGASCGCASTARSTIARRGARRACKKTASTRSRSVVDRIASSRRGASGWPTRSRRALGVGKGIVRVLDEARRRAGLQRAGRLPAAAAQLLRAAHPRNFSFNSPYGACPPARAWASLLEFDASSSCPTRVARRRARARCRSGARSRLDGTARSSRRWSAVRLLPRNAPARSCAEGAEDPPARHGRRGGRGRHSGDAARPLRRTHFEGVIPNLLRRYRETQSSEMRELDREVHEPAALPDCGGRAPEAREPRGADRRAGTSTTWTRLSRARRRCSVDGAAAPGERERQIARAGAARRSATGCASWTTSGSAT